jgi:hypothetical protein
MKHIRLPVVDDSEMVFGLAFQRADGEVVVARRERDQEIRVRLLLNRDRLRVESRDCGWKKDCGISRFEGSELLTHYGNGVRWLEKCWPDGVC